MISCATTTTLADVVFFLNKHRILSVPVINDEGEVSRCGSTQLQPMLDGRAHLSRAGHCDRGRRGPAHVPPAQPARHRRQCTSSQPSTMVTLLVLADLEAVWRQVAPRRAPAARTRLQRWASSGWVCVVVWLVDNRFVCRHPDWRGAGVPQEGRAGPVAVGALHRHGGGAASGHGRHPPRLRLRRAGQPQQPRLVSAASFRMFG